MRPMRARSRRWGIGIRMIGFASLSAQARINSLRSVDTQRKANSATTGAWNDSGEPRTACAVINSSPSASL